MTPVTNRFARHVCVKNPISEHACCGPERLVLFHLRPTSQQDSKFSASYNRHNMYTSCARLFTNRVCLTFPSLFPEILKNIPWNYLYTKMFLSCFVSFFCLSIFSTLSFWSTHDPKPSHNNLIMTKLVLSIFTLS